MKAKRVKEIFEQISDDFDIFCIGDNGEALTPLFIETDHESRIYIGQAERIGDLSYGKLLNPENEL